MPQALLLKLPHEVLLYILKQYLDLTDLWTLTRASKDLRCIALLLLRKQWSVASDSLVKTQLNAAMIAVSGISQRIIKRITIYDPYAFPPILPQNPRNWLYLTLTDTTVYDLAIYQHPLPDQPSVSEARSPSPPNTFPPTIEPGLDEGTEHFFPMERIKYQCKRLHYIIGDERKLHYRIARNITRENLNTVIESIFHHVIFVNSRWMIMSRRQSAIAISRARAFAAAIARLLCSLGVNFKNEVVAMVWENMATFITYVEYRLLGKSNGNNNSNLMDTITVFLNFVCACYVAHIIVDEQALDAFYKIYHVTGKTYKDQTRRSLRELWLRTDRDLEDGPLSRYLNLVGDNQ
ncbi:hypothetical protein MUCCIDRAFT_167649 [Mucor lusitanicus CBS 277.49]|uniref:F-box domain-containing protein n=2 Tax=Mucor circinelloides f. lusitanicus TaxID=29924 RepID=A0A168HAV8_MUCCL|nr:hypothetical protein MUCCIDRAFT_167649 [Mucor lusitanicus CBS 277.49]